jgi:hypothetical protein
METIRREVGALGWLVRMALLGSIAACDLRGKMRWAWRCS